MLAYIWPHISSGHYYSSFPLLRDFIALPFVFVYSRVYSLAFLLDNSSPFIMSCC